MISSLIVQVVQLAVPFFNLHQHYYTNMPQEGGAALPNRSIEGKLHWGNLKIRLGSEGYKQFDRERNAKRKAKREARFAAMLEAEAVEAAAVEMAAKQPRTQVIADWEAFHQS
jgi:hypothetical protein